MFRLELAELAVSEVYSYNQ